MTITESYRIPSGGGKEQKVDWVVLKENLQGKGPEYVFANAGIEMIPTEAETVYLALEALRYKAE
jgi:predicted Fe-Mo cluster-binding NifX family protein